MPDEIMEELWQIKDDIAREHGYDIRRLAAHLQAIERARLGQALDARAAARILEAVNTSDPAPETPGG